MSLLSLADASSGVGLCNKRLKATTPTPGSTSDTTKRLSDSGNVPVSHHRPLNSRRAGELFDEVVTKASTESDQQCLLKGASLLIRKVVPGAPLTEEVNALCEAAQALIALFLATSLSTTQVSIIEGSLIFQLRLPLEKAVEVLHQVQQKPRELLDLQIRCVAVLATNLSELVRLDTRKGAAAGR